MPEIVLLTVSLQPAGRIYRITGGYTGLYDRGSESPIPLWPCLLQHKVSRDTISKLLRSRFGELNFFQSELFASLCSDYVKPQIAPTSSRKTSTEQKDLPYNSSRPYISYALRLTQVPPLCITIQRSYTSPEKAPYNNIFCQW
jgi:hypothetical protein